ncbi:hypothetical protein Y888_17185 [Mixta calida B021323]|nr:hypothetical protein Y888_17185 [Mixta calida B021323]
MDTFAMKAYAISNDNFFKIGMLALLSRAR